MSKATEASVTILPPSGVRNAIHLMTTTDIALFIWGSPGLAKSSVGQQVATEQNKAFVDVRLSMYAPTDVLGMPYRVEENGETVGVAFTPPKILPRDLDEHKVKSIEAIPTKVSFTALNGKGSNGIYYVKEPTISVSAISPEGATAEIVEQSPEHFVVQIVGADGKLTAGRVAYSITGKAEAIVAFEELNSAPLATQQAAYQFILDRRVGEYVVPEGVRLIAMGNKNTDKGLTYTQPSPLANRFTHIEMRVDFSDWQEWAIGALVHPHVVGYLSNNKHELNTFDPSTSVRGFATPRSWVFVSDIIKALDKPNAPEITGPQINALICGSIGDGTGTKFNAFRKIHDKLPKIDDILAGRVTSLDKDHKDNVAVAFSLVTSLCYALRLEHESLNEAGLSARSEDKRREEWFKSFNRVLEFWMNNFQPEVNVMGLRAVTSIHNLPVQRRDLMPALKDFTQRYSDLIR